MPTQRDVIRTPEPSEFETPHSLVVPRGALEHDPLPSSSRSDEVGELYCPFEPGVNPNVDVAQSRSVEWAQRVGLLRDDGEAARLDAARIAHLGGLVFRTASPEVLELVTRWTTLFCVLDDHIESRRVGGTMKLAAHLQAILSRFELAPRAGAEDALDRAFAAMRSDILELGGERFVVRFASELERLFDGYLWEQFYRQTGATPEYGAYRALRNVTIGLRPHFLLGELEAPCCGTEEIRSHPTLCAMEEMTCLAVGWANDIFTHGKELAHGEPHNLVAVLMQSHSLSRRQALLRAQALHDAEVRSLLHAGARLPDFGEREEAAHAHVEHLQHWIRGHLDWAIQTGRYDPPASRVRRADAQW